MQHHALTLLAILLLALSACGWLPRGCGEWRNVGSFFVGKFIIEPDEEERSATVHQEFRYFSKLLNRWLVIPKGFRTDGASVPRLFWNIIPPWGRYGMAAVIHDFLYRWQRTSRQVADAVLLEAMKAKRCVFWQYACIWIAVRLFGAFAWRWDQAKPLSAAELAVNPLAGGPPMGNQL